MAFDTAEPWTCDSYRENSLQMTRDDNNIPDNTICFYF